MTVSAEPTRPVILVVDDEPENLALLERTFGLDYDVRTASSGQEALKLLPELPELAVIVTDQRMPGMTGTEFLTEARVRRADAVRIILTGYMSPDDLIDAINSSRVYRYLTKPWDVEKLRVAVHHAVRLYEMGGGALVDEVTGLPNRGFVRRELDREVARSVRTNRPLSIISAKVIGYELLVATQGRAAGEKLLTTVGREMAATLRVIDMLGVYADGVFVALLPECGDAEAAAKRLRNIPAIEAALTDARATVPTMALDIKSVIYKGDSSAAVYLTRELGLES